MTETRADFLDAALSIAPRSGLDVLRRRRPEARLRTQTSFEALFEPANFGALSAEERYAAAAEVARVTESKALEHRYLEAFERLRANSGRLKAIVAHAGRIGRAPGGASRDDLETLAAAGLTPAAIVTLSQIIAFVAYQARAAAALALLRGNR
jgi:uncharacterized protein YciW